MVETTKGENPYACLFDTGTYIGDGTLNQVIGGLPFNIRLVHIWKQAVASENGVIWMKSDQDVAALCVHIEAAWIRVGHNDKVIQILNNSFSVDDAAANLDPNAVDVVYCYAIWGNP